MTSVVVGLTGGSQVFNPGVYSDGFRLDSRQLPQIQHNWVFNLLKRFLSWIPTLSPPLDEGWYKKKKEEKKRHMM